jgi:hypothetical protein
MSTDTPPSENGEYDTFTVSPDGRLVNSLGATIGAPFLAGIWVTFNTGAIKIIDYGSRGSRASRRTDLSGDVEPLHSLQTRQYYKAAETDVRPPVR